MELGRHGIFDHFNLMNFQALTTLAMLLIAMKATKNLVSVPLVLKNDTKQNKQVLKVGTFLGMPVNIFFLSLRNMKRLFTKTSQVVNVGILRVDLCLYFQDEFLLPQTKLREMFLHLPVILFPLWDQTDADILPPGKNMGPDRK